MFVKQSSSSFYFLNSVLYFLQDIYFDIVFISFIIIFSEKGKKNS